MKEVIGAGVAGTEAIKKALINNCIDLYLLTFVKEVSDLVIGSVY